MISIVISSKINLINIFKITSINLLKIKILNNALYIFFTIHISLLLRLTRD